MRGPSPAGIGSSRSRDGVLLPADMARLAQPPHQSTAIPTACQLTGTVSILKICPVPSWDVTVEF